MIALLKASAAAWVDRLLGPSPRPATNRASRVGILQQWGTLVDDPPMFCSCCDGA